MMKKELLVKNLGWESYREAVSYILIISEFLNTKGRLQGDVVFLFIYD